jgi:hypothetical protein
MESPSLGSARLRLLTALTCRYSGHRRRRKMPDLSRAISGGCGKQAVRSAAKWQRGQDQRFGRS